MARRKRVTHEAEDMIARVSRSSDGEWSVQWAQEAPAVEQKGQAATADAAKAFVEGQMSAITRLRWVPLGEDWVAYRKSRG